MANFFTKTASQFRQPLAFLSAFAAGCLVTSTLPAQETQIPTGPGSKLNDIFTLEEKIEFSPVPAMVDRLPETASQVMRAPKPEPVFNPPIEDGPSVQDFFGELQDKGTVAPTKAKMVVPSTPLRSFGQTKKASRIPTAENAFSPSMSTPGFSAPTNQSTLSNSQILSEQSVNVNPNSATLVSYNQQTTDYPQQFRQPVVAPIRSSATPRQFSRMPLTNAQARQNVPAQRVAALPATPGATFGRSYSGVHRLENLNINQFETRVLQIWGNRIKTSASPDGRYVRVELPTKIRDRMTMMVDRQSQSLTYEGGDSLKDNWHNLVQQIDGPMNRRVNGRVVQSVLVDGAHTDESLVRQVAFLMGISQEDEGVIQLPAGTVPEEALPGMAGQDEIQAGTQGIKNRVKIIQDPETGIFQLIGDPDDIAIIRDVILKITKESAGVEQLAVQIPLKNLQSETIAPQIQTMYDNSSFASDYGSAQIQPLASPNSLIVLGQQKAIDAVQGIVNSMDTAPPEGQFDGFKPFKLKYIAAADAAVRLRAYFGQVATGAGQNALPPAPVIVVPDFRSNTVVVKGSEQFILQAEQYLASIDVIDSPTVNEVKIIPLRNTTAADMAIVIQDAINGQQQNSGQGTSNAAQQNQVQPIQANANQSEFNSTIRSPALSLKTIDQSGDYTSGIMFDVRVTADANSNSLVVTGPKESMPLIEALVRQLDRLPNTETQIKVFEIVNGDAQTLFDMLTSLFGADQAQAGGQGTNPLSQLPLQGASSSDGQTLVNLRFSFDLRSNTIIASGAAGDLQVVEDLLNRLDAEVYEQMPTKVYRLSNAPAFDVAEAINSWLEGIVDLNTSDPRRNTGVTVANRTVIVVEEVVSNSLIVSARPEYRAQIEEIIRALDRRPPMVKVEVLIAEVDLNTLEEFGVELGVQDSLLFDRGTTLGAGGNIIDGSIGFPFNQVATANANSVSPNNLAGQALSNLGLGRINSDLGFGGLVLSAGNESISILMRALKDRQCIRTLSRPHIMTIENLQGRVSIGAEVPRVAGATPNGLTVTQDIEFVDVGVILEVTPRVSPDGMIIMAVNAQKSSVGPDETGITIGFGANGEPITSPQIIETEANTTLMARSGQTVVFSGLIQEEKVHIERGAPILSDLPVIGPLFKFESDSASRSELLIIMTPYLVTDDESLQAQNYAEYDRMHWCECDVAEVYGSTDYQGHSNVDSAVETFYPDMDPRGAQPVMPQPGIQEVIQAPQPGFEVSQADGEAIEEKSTKSPVRRASFLRSRRR